MTDLVPPHRAFRTADDLFAHFEKVNGLQRPPAGLPLIVSGYLGLGIEQASVVPSTLSAVLLPATSTILVAGLIYRIFPLWVGLCAMTAFGTMAVLIATLLTLELKSRLLERQRYLLTLDMVARDGTDVFELIPPGCLCDACLRADADSSDTEEEA